MKMLLIDGNSMLFRAYYATCYGQMLKTSDGIYTNAVFAFANMLNKALKLTHPEYLVVAFDKGKHNFRHDIDKDYKGTRKSAPEELVPQFKIVREYLDAFHIPYLEYDEIEADDIIGSLSKKYQDVQVDILTSDRDLLQLIDDTTRVYLMKKGLSDMQMMDQKALKETYGLSPKQVIDLKALMGDSSDNIKGVEGIGPKTAEKFLAQYDNVENLYKHLDEIKGKVKDKLIAGKDSCFKSKILATIKTDVEIKEDLKTFKLDLDYEKVNDFYERYEMYSLKFKNKQSVDNLANYKRVDHISEDLLKEKAVIYFDSDHFSYYDANIYGLAIALDGRAEYLPYEDLLKDQATLDYLKSDLKKFTYDLKWAKHALDNKKIELGYFDDLMLMTFLKNNYLDDLDKIFLEFKLNDIVPLQDVYGTVKKPKMIDAVLECKRSCEIALGLLEVSKKIDEMLKEEEVLSLYHEVELPLLYVLYDVEKNGIHCDAKILEKIGEENSARIADLISEIYELAGHEFNINSPKQLASVLFDELGLPPNKKRSTSIEYLSDLLKYHPIIDKLISYRKFSKIQSSYVEGLLRYIKEDERIHTVFSQTITQTGRLSSYDPNLQNISVRDEEGKVIRKAFLASDQDHILISSDYSQIELRILSALSHEEKMIEAFNKHIDIHTKTAMDIFNVTHDEVNDTLRRKAKAINFGVIYGISDFGLAKQAGLSLQEARHYIDTYFVTYPNIKAFLDTSIAFCKEKGYVTTMMKRRRYIKEINDKNYMLREFGKRAAMNSRIQGSAADLIKVAMIKISKKIKEMGLKSKMVLQIHDELIFDVPLSEKEVMLKLIDEEMKNAYKLDVLLDNSISYAYSWYDAK